MRTTAGHLRSSSAPQQPGSLWTLMHAVTQSGGVFLFPFNVPSIFLIPIPFRPIVFRPIVHSDPFHSNPMYSIPFRPFLFHHFGTLPFHSGTLPFHSNILPLHIPRYDYLEFTPEGENVKVKCDGEVGQNRWPTHLEFKGQRLQFIFYSDGSNNEWGYKFTVSLHLGE